MTAESSEDESDRHRSQAEAIAETSPESEVSAQRPGALATIPLALASVLYGVGARVHGASARRMRAAGGRPACAVLSVGGLTVGGAGKTPVAARLALGLHRRGRRVVLASRGYKGSPRGRVTVVSDGRHVLSSVETSGDESLVLAAHAPGVPVLTGVDRRVVGHHAVSAYDAEILVLDDGFQHHRLERDLDIVCVDGIAGFGNGRVLPWGPLREPLSALGRADWLCVVDGGPEERETERIAEFASRGGRVIRARRRPAFLSDLEGRAREPASMLAGESVGMLAGVARPASLRRSLEALGAEVVAEKIFRDHHDYRREDVAGLDAAVSRWVTTEKDALKILPAWIGDAQVSVLGIEVALEDEEGVLASIESILAERRARLRR